MDDELNAVDSAIEGTDVNVETFAVLEAVTRLLLGGTLEGSAELVNRLRLWEEETAVSRQNIPPTEEDTATQVRYALIGALFSAQSRLKKTQLPLFKRAAQLATNSIATIITPATHNRVARSLDGQLNEWSQRGESILNKWVENGRVEETQSRAIARHATTETINEVINLLAENDELQNLITEQGTGLATEALDQARERTVSADEIAERFVRTLLRRPKRETYLPAPSEINET